MTVDVAVRRGLRWAEGSVGRRLGSERLDGGLTSTMLRLTDPEGPRLVLRLMTEEPWRAHGAALVSRERMAQQELEATTIPAPRSLAVDPGGEHTTVAAHLMTALPGQPRTRLEDVHLEAMAAMLARIHDVRPARRFRTYESWAWPAKRVVPPWAEHPRHWRAAFAILAEAPPAYAPTFLQRDFSHRNLLWDDARISGVVDWVETSTGPAWLDAAHAATTLAVHQSVAAARTFLAHYGALTGRAPEQYWQVLDAVGFLPPPGRPPMFGRADQLRRLEEWLGNAV